MWNLRHLKSGASFLKQPIPTTIEINGHFAKDVSENTTETLSHSLMNKKGSNTNDYNKLYLNYYLKNFFLLMAPGLIS